MRPNSLEYPPFMFWIVPACVLFVVLIALRAADGSVSDVAPAHSSELQDGGMALRFDKDSPELRIAPNAACEPEELTIELWAKIEGVQPEHAQLVRKLAHWEKPGYLLAVSQSGYGCIQFRWFDGTLKTIPDSILGTWYHNQWHHFAAVYSKTRVSLFVDGIEVSHHENTAAAPLQNDPEAPIRIGAEGFVGQIDELRLWSRALTSTKIRSNLYRSLRGSEAGLIGYWSFDETTGTDRSSNKLIFEGGPDLTTRLVQSDAPIASFAKIKEHRLRVSKIAKGRKEVGQAAARLPPLNAAIYRFSTSLINEPFGSGDCWNFVNQAMITAGAKRRDIYVFGDEVTLENALPGDLIQFEKFSSANFGTEHHSAILWRNAGNNTISIVHQNAPPNGAKVGLLEIDLKTASGTMLFFRPKE